MTVVTVLLCSCGTDEFDNISERRSGYYVGEADGYSVTAVSGVREDPYTADGKAGKLKAYTLITLTPSDFDIDAVYTFAVESGGSSYGGTLIVHPFAASFSAEFDAEIKTEFSVTIKRGDKSVTVPLRSLVTSDMISYDRAIDAANTALHPSGDYEIRVRMIRDPLGGDGVCWHVSFITSDSNKSVLLDPVTAKVLAKKE